MSLQSRQLSHRACSSRQQELQRRLEKLHEEKDIVVNTLEQIIKGMDLVVAHVSSITTNVDSFLCSFESASAAVEELYLKLFKIQLLLSTGNNYPDTVQQKAPQVAITFPSSGDDGEDGDPNVTVIDGNKNLHSFQLSSSQHASSTSPQHLFAHDKLLGHTTLTAGPVDLQQNVPHVVVPDTAVSTSLSLQTAPAAYKAGKVPALPATYSAASCTEAHATDVSAAMKRHPSAGLTTVTGFDHRYGGFYRKGNDQRKWPKDGLRATQPNVSVASPHSVQSQGGQAGAAIDGTAEFTLSQHASSQSTSPSCTSVVQELCEMVQHEIPTYYPDILNTEQDVSLSFYKNPLEFWLHLKASAKQLDTFLAKLDEHYSCRTQRRAITAKPGMSCAAFYAQDGHWYRVKITQVFPDHVMAYFVDFGNTERVDLNSLCLLNKQFALLPGQALYCGINGLNVPCGMNKFSSEAVHSLRETVFAPYVKMQAFFHNLDCTSRYRVDITAEGLGNTVMNLSQECLDLGIKEGSPLLHAQEDVEKMVEVFNPFSNRFTLGSTATSSSAALPPAVMCTAPNGRPSSSMPTPVAFAPTSMAAHDLAPPGLAAAGMTPAGMAALGLTPAGTAGPGLTSLSMAGTPLGMAGAPLSMAGAPLSMAGAPLRMAGAPLGMAGAPLGVAGLGSTPLGVAASALTPAGMAALSSTPAGMAAQGLTLPCMAGPGLTSLGMAAPSSTPAVMSVLGLIPAAMAAPGPTPTGMIAPDVAPAGVAAPDVTPASMAAPGMTSAGVASPDVTPASVAAPGMTPAGIAAPHLTQAGMTVPNMNAPGIGPPGLALHGIATPGCSVNHPVPGLSVCGSVTPALPAALLALSTLSPDRFIQEISTQQMALSRSQSAQMAPTRFTAPAPVAYMPSFPFPFDLMPAAVVPPAILPEGNTFPVILSVVFNPSDFYGQIIDKVNTTAQVLEELHQNLNMLCIETPAPAEESVAKGTYWACYHEGDRKWYRAQVLNIILTAGSRRYRVLYVDYGNRNTVSLTYLRALPHTLSCLPACAYRMALALVAPRNGPKWDSAATGLFVQETGFSNPLVAEKKAQRRCSLENVVEVVLWKSAVNINTFLVERGTAVLKPE